MSREYICRYCKKTFQVIDVFEDTNYCNRYCKELHNERMKVLHKNKCKDCHKKD